VHGAYHYALFCFRSHSEYLKERFFVRLGSANVVISYKSARAVYEKTRESFSFLSYSIDTTTFQAKYCAQKNMFKEVFSREKAITPISKA
jgi:hypothetical protein